MATQHDTTLNFQVKETIYALTVKGSCFTATHSAPENFTKLLKVVAVHLQPVAINVFYVCHLDKRLWFIERR